MLQIAPNIGQRTLVLAYRVQADVEQLRQFFLRHSPMAAAASAMRAKLLSKQGSPFGHRYYSVRGTSTKMPENR